jgi:hypothetical protein
VKSVERAVADLARESRQELWPRFTARRAGVSTSEAREAMLELVRAGLLDLWYVVLSDGGDEVSRHKHPETAPIGTSVTSLRGEEPETFVVEPDDVYLMFSPTDRLEHLVGFEGADDPKARGVESGASALTSSDPADEERGPSSPRWNGVTIIFEEHHHHGDDVAGDKIVGGDKVGRDKIGGNRLENTGSGTLAQGDHATAAGALGSASTPGAAAASRKGKLGSAMIIAVGIVLALGLIGLFVLLGHAGTLGWPLAIACAALSAGTSIAISNAIASHVRA